MITDWIPAAVLVAIITVAGTVYGVSRTRKTAKETNEINEADSLIRNLAAEVQRQDSRLDRLDQTVREQGEQIRHLQRQEWALKRYVHRLIDRIRSLGGEPPEPPPDISL